MVDFVGFRTEQKCGNDIFKNRNRRRQMESVIAIQGNRKIINCPIKVVAEASLNVSICLKILRLLDAVIFFNILQYLPRTKSDRSKNYNFDDV